MEHRVTLVGRGGKVYANKGKIGFDSSYNTVYEREILLKEYLDNRWMFNGYLSPNNPPANIKMGIYDQSKLVEEIIYGIPHKKIKGSKPVSTQVFWYDYDKIFLNEEEVKNILSKLDYRSIVWRSPSHGLEVNGVITYSYRVLVLLDKEISYDYYEYNYKKFAPIEGYDESFIRDTNKSLNPSKVGTLKDYSLVQKPMLSCEDSYINTPYSYSWFHNLNSEFYYDNGKEYCIPIETSEAKKNNKKVYAPNSVVLRDKIKDIEYITTAVANSFADKNWHHVSLIIIKEYLCFDYPDDILQELVLRPIAINKNIPNLNKIHLFKEGIYHFYFDEKDITRLLAEPKLQELRNLVKEVAIKIGTTTITTVEYLAEIQQFSIVDHNEMQVEAMLGRLPVLESFTYNTETKGGGIVVKLDYNKLKSNEGLSYLRRFYTISSAPIILDRIQTVYLDTTRGFMMKDNQLCYNKGYDKEEDIIRDSLNLVPNANGKMHPSIMNFVRDENNKLRNHFEALTAISIFGVMEGDRLIEDKNRFVFLTYGGKLGGEGKSSLWDSIKGIRRMFDLKSPIEPSRTVELKASSSSFFNEQFKEDTLVFFCEENFDPTNDITAIMKKITDSYIMIEEKYKSVRIERKMKSSLIVTSNKPSLYNTIFREGEANRRYVPIKYRSYQDEGAVFDSDFFNYVKYEKKEQLRPYLERLYYVYLSVVTSPKGWLLDQDQDKEFLLKVRESIDEEITFANMTEVMFMLIGYVDKVISLRNDSRFFEYSYHSMLDYMTETLRKSKGIKDKLKMRVDISKRLKEINTDYPFMEWFGEDLWRLKEEMKVSELDSIDYEENDTNFTLEGFKSFLVKRLTVLKNQTISKIPF